MNPILERARTVQIPEFESADDVPTSSECFPRLLLLPKVSDGIERELVLAKYTQVVATEARWEITAFLVLAVASLAGILLSFI